MNYHRIIVVAILTLLGVSGVAQDKWSQGTLELVSTKVFQGDFCLKVAHNVVLYKRGEEVMVFPAHRVLSLRVYDENEKMIRTFAALKMEKGAQKLFEFYEILVDGPIKVLRRQQVDWYAINIDVVDYDYYLWQSDQLQDLFKFRRKIYPDLVKQSDGQIKDFVKINKLSTSRLEDIMRIVAFFNNQQSFHNNNLAKN